MDGMSFNVKADTSTGHFDVSERSDEDDEEPATPRQNTTSYNTIDYMDKKELRNKFFELNA